MFEDYIQDAYSFYELAEERTKLGNTREAKMYYRAAVFCAASSLEAFVNFIGDTFKKGNNLDKCEIAYLNDLTLEVSPTKAVIEEKLKFNPIESKVQFIINRFNVPIQIEKSSEWANFLKFKDLRNSLIHPKDLSDEIELTDYSSRIKKGLNANIDLMNHISSTLFNKPLRKGLTELKL